jgi:hypothetical protein
LAAATTKATKALADSDDLPPLDLAEVMVETTKLSTKLSKLVDRVDRLSCPLLGPRGAAPSNRPTAKVAARGRSSEPSHWRDLDVHHHPVAFDGVGRQPRLLCAESAAASFRVAVCRRDPRVGRRLGRHLLH